MKRKLAGIILTVVMTGCLCGCAEEQNTEQNNPTEATVQETTASRSDLESENLEDEDSEETEAARPVHIIKPFTFEEVNASLVNISEGNSLIWVGDYGYRFPYTISDMYIAEEDADDRKINDLVVKVDDGEFVIGHVIQSGDAYGNRSDPILDSDLYWCDIELYRPEILEGDIQRMGYIQFVNEETVGFRDYVVEGKVDVLNLIDRNHDEYLSEDVHEYVMSNEVVLSHMTAGLMGQVSRSKFIERFVPDDLFYFVERDGELIYIEYLFRV